MTNYLFEDIFYKFRVFFNTQQNRESRFLYDVAFGFMPRKFEANETDQIIYDEEDEVPELYFILDGLVGVACLLMASGNLNKKEMKIGKKLKSDCIICDHYVVNKHRSQFIYLALKDVRSFALTKKFLQKEIFPKYPEIAAQIKSESELRYRRNIQRQMVSKNRIS